MHCHHLLPIITQDYDEDQLRDIADRYPEEDCFKRPCFFEMPFKRTLGLNTFGKGLVPHMNEANSHYLGKCINVEVGQLLVVSCMLWHATALPCPIYGRVIYKEEDGSLAIEEQYVTCSDARLHFYFGCHDSDVNDQNLFLPVNESGMTKSTTYTSPQVPHFSTEGKGEHLLNLSKIMFKDQQINQKVKVICPPIPRDKVQNNN